MGIEDWHLGGTGRQRGGESERGNEDKTAHAGPVGGLGDLTMHRASDRESTGRHYQRRRSAA
jgi:hypothetical protein